MYAWVREHAQEEKKAKDTEEQFIYKARKKAIGPFKQQLWALPADVRETIGASLQEQFAFLMSKLRIQGTSAVVSKARHGRSADHRLARRCGPCRWRQNHRRRSARPKAFPTRRGF